MKSKTCVNISLPVYIGRLLPGVPGTMTDWLKIFQVGNKSICHFYVILSVSYIASCKKQSDTCELTYLEKLDIFHYHGVF